MAAFFACSAVVSSAVSTQELPSGAVEKKFEVIAEGGYGDKPAPFTICVIMAGKVAEDFNGREGDRVVLSGTLSQMKTRVGERENIAPMLRAKQFDLMASAIAPASAPVPAPAPAPSVTASPMAATESSGRPASQSVGPSAIQEAEYENIPF